MTKLKIYFAFLIPLFCYVTASAHDFEVGGIYYNITSDSDFTVAVTFRGSSYNSYSNEYSGDMTIPEKVIYDSKKYSVTSIGERAFYNCSGLTSVTIPNSVTSIGDYAFGYCSGLTSVTIPNSVTSIGKFAFYGCTGALTVNCNIPSASNGSSGVFNGSKFTSVTIGGNVTEIGNYAFYGCSVLTSVTIPNSVTSIGSSAFHGCSGLTNVTIPNSVTSIGSSAFYNCSGLTSMIIPNSVTSIGNSAFMYCSSLTSVTIPNSVTSIGERAFYNCSGLTSMIIPNSVTSIGNSAFYGCTGALTVNCNIPSASNGGSGVFYGSKFTSVTIGGNVTEIGNYAFYGCSGLTSVTIPNSVTSIGSSAFDGCSGLTNVTIPNSVTSIGSSAFYNCSGLTSMIIPNSVTSIGNSAFYNCKSLYCVFNESDLSITKGSTSNGYVAYYAKCVVKGKGEIIDDYMFRTNETGEHYLCGYLGAKTVITLPEKYRGEDYGIDEYAFSGNTDLASVTIPNSVTSIGSSAFYNCSGLTSVIIPNSVTSIGSSAFYQCSGLTSVIIPNSVTSIGSYAFYNCSGLTSVIIPNSVTSIGNYAFYGCTGALTVNCNIPSASNGSSGVFYGSKFTSVTIGGDVTEIGNYAFYQRSGLTSVIIPNSVTSIGSSAFDGCSGLTNVTIPNSVTSIGDRAFSSCSGLTSIIIPNSVTSIGNYAFYNCKSLHCVFNESDLSITKGSTSNGYVAYYAKCVVKGKGEIIDDYVFRTNETDEHYLCGYLGTETVITLPEKYRGEDYGIDESAFSGNADLVSVTIPSSVTSIGSSAFFNCTSLISVYSERENPLTVDYSVFACKNKSNSLEVYIPNEASLYVPYGCKAAYEGEAGWSTFKNIVEINPIICEIKDTAVIIEKELSLPISIRNDVGITGFQCDIYIPEGLTLKTNEKGEYDITLNEERCDDHSIYMRRMPDGAVRIIVMSMSSSDIIGTEGNMLTLNLIAGDSIGNHKVEVKNFNASDQKGKLYNANDTTGTVAVYYIPGDVNNDGMVAVNDIVYVVNYLLEDIAPDFHFSAADMDCDGNVFINDVVLIVNKILNAEPNTVHSDK